MTDDRSAGDRGPLAGLDAEAHIDGEVIDLSDNSGPELTTDVDDVDAGSAGGVGPRD